MAEPEATADDVRATPPRGMLTVGLAEADDLADLVALQAAHDTHYMTWTGTPPLPDEAASERIFAALFGARPVAEALLARRAGAPVGLLYFSELFPGADLRRAIFVKDIFVLDSARRSGVGRALLARVRRIARGRGADRVELHTHPDMTEARAFYAKEGLKEAERIVFRVDL